MKVTSRIKDGEYFVELLFDKEEVYYNCRYWNSFEHVLGFEYHIYNCEYLDNEVEFSVRVMIEDDDLTRFPDGIRRHQTTMPIQDFVIRGCNNNQEKYEWLLNAGHNMRNIGFSYSNVVFDKRISVLKKHMLEEVQTAIYYTSKKANVKDSYSRAIKRFLY